MEIKIEVEKLRKRPLMIGTPMYGGVCSAPYMISMIDLTNRFMQYGIPLKTCIIENESLITRARNNIMHMFMNQSEFNRLLFIDADIKFSVNAVLTLLALSDQYPVICGSYPKKAIDWKMIEKAVKAGIEPDKLKDYCDNAVLNFIPSETGTQKIDLSKPVEVLDTGTGFMMIRLDVPHLMAKQYPEIKYTPDYALQNPGFDNTKENGVYAFFDTRIHTDETSIAKRNAGVKRYLSEDYSFCELWRRMGGSIYVCPFISLDHHGSFLYRGRLQECMALKSNEYEARQKEQHEKDSKNAT